MLKFDSSSDFLKSYCVPADAVLVTDTNVERILLPKLPSLAALPRFTLEAGERSKTLETAASLWKFMADRGVRRNSVVINLGGGVVTDLGGFCAATFKRGARCVNIPTTILGMVDAAIGGKTGIDFAGAKNLVGVFAMPEEVIVVPELAATLPESERLSGLGEIVKTKLLGQPEPDLGQLDLAADIPFCAAYKEDVVAKDPTEKGLRKVLNLGHTAGHAFESMMLRRGTPLPHGVAVLHGLLAALVLSRMELGLEPRWLDAVASVVRELPRKWWVPITCDDYPELLGYMLQDKKNSSAGTVNWVLLKTPGSPVIDVPLEPSRIEAALDIYRDLLGI